MAELKPFNAIRYQPSRVGGIAAVVAPPYDVISPEFVGRLYDRSRYNVVRLILNRDSERHEAAARELRSWLSDGILLQDQDPALWFYSQTFETARYGRLTRDGIIGRLRLEEFGSGKVCPHERTFEGPKADRLRLFKACRANLSPIFGVVACAGTTFRQVVAESLTEAPWADVIDDGGVQHRLWPVRDPKQWAGCADLVRDEPVLIADGHHRYETALQYRDEMRRAHPDAGADAPFESVLTFLSDINDVGLVVLPTHRVLEGGDSAAVRATVESLGELFGIEKFPLTERARFTRALEGDERGIGCVFSDSLILLSPNGDLERSLPDRSAATRRLAVVLLHELILSRLPEGAAGEISFTHEDDEAFSAVTSGRAGAAFLVGAPSARDVRAVCVAGETMPEKSTYFYPKLLTGLVFKSLA